MGLLCGLWRCCLHRVDLTLYPGVLGVQHRVRHRAEMRTRVEPVLLQELLDPAQAIGALGMVTVLFVLKVDGVVEKVHAVIENVCGLIAFLN